MTLEEKYTELCNTPSDIYKHLPKLRECAEKCEHVTEMGFRWGCSTYALLVAKPKKLISYDIVYDPDVENVKAMADGNGLSFEFINKDVLSVEIEETDLLFIDTFHTTRQCTSELNLHSGKVKKYLIFHDVNLFWTIGEDGNPEGGLKYAIEPFMESHPEWKEVYRTQENNGLLILERC
jgi:hypothetical protein